MVRIDFPQWGWENAGGAVGETVGREAVGAVRAPKARIIGGMEDKGVVLLDTCLF